MRIYDMHCDVLYKMLLEPGLSFDDEHILDVTYARLQEGKLGLQAFAIFLPEDRVPMFTMIEDAASSLERKILSRPHMRFVKTQADLLEAERSGQLGVMLTLEGAEGLMGSMDYLERAFELGVRCLGLTWNYANWAADGVLEDRRAGLTVKGRELIHTCNQLGMIMDISHLNEPGFWEVMELSEKPVIASHSNSYQLVPHPRNLRDDQIMALIQKGGRIGLTFVPDFIGGDRSIKDVISHLEHVCSLGGEDSVGFGSDFDGIDEHLVDLAHPGHYERLVEELLKNYSEAQTRKFLAYNWHSFFRENLPV